MKILVTGASGFVGRHVVANALRRGHSVRAMVRPAADMDGVPWTNAPRLTMVRADLRAQQGLVPAVSDIDVVLHLAAAKTGDLYDQLAGTVVATENLLFAMEEARVPRILLVSTFSVYGYLRKRSWSLLDEHSPLEDVPEMRDAYCQTKLLQERLVREHCARSACDFTIVRPGVIYGKDNLWTARIGTQLTPRIWVRIGGSAMLPLTYVENCAEAVVVCAESHNAIGETFNVVDDGTPTQRHYVRLLRRRVTPRPTILPLPWILPRVMSRIAGLVNKIAFSEQAKLPSILIPARLHARCKPLRYSNTTLRTATGWRPRYSLDQAMDRTRK